MRLKVKALFISLALCLFSSCTKSDSWQNLSIKTGDPVFDSAKLFYPASNYIQDFQIEFLYVEDTVHGYVNFFTAKAPIFQDKEDLTKLKIFAKEKEYEITADRLAGGQRIRFSPDTIALLVKLLQENPSVTLFFKEGLKFKISSESFKKHFHSLKAKPLLFIPNDPIGLAL